MGQTGRRSIATHILAVKIVSAAAHFHGFGVARQGPWNTWVNKASEAALCFFEWHHVRDLTVCSPPQRFHRDEGDRYGGPACPHSPGSARRSPEAGRTLRGGGRLAAYRRGGHPPQRLRGYRDPH